MKEEGSSPKNQDFYTVERLNDIVILRLGKNFLFESIARAINHPVLDVFDDISENRDIKVLIITNCPEKTTGDEYIDFCKHAIAEKFESKSIYRMCNFFDQKGVEPFFSARCWDTPKPASCSCQTKIYPPWMPWNWVL
jgi:hypothetical protein